MTKAIRSLGALGISLALTLPALAETYTFTGANYTAAYLGNPGPTGTFTNAMRVTGSFTRVLRVVF